MPFPNISNLSLFLPARADIRDILHYTYQQYGKRQQELYYAALCEGLERIAGNSGLGHTRPDLQKPYKAYTVKKHVLVYKTKHD